MFKKEIRFTMLGSCCEEQEAREAEARSKHRAAVKASEARLLKGDLLRQHAFNTLHDPETCGCLCGECEEDGDGAEEASVGTQGTAAAPQSSDSDDEDDDEMEAAIVRKMRAARLAQLQGAAAARREAGTYQRLDEAALVDRLRGEAPIVLHLARSDSITSACIDKRLAAAASTAPPQVRVVRCSADDGPPAVLPFVRRLPALLVVQDGAVTASADGLADVREPRALEDAAESWVRDQLARLAVEAAAADSEEEGEECAEAFCGRPGCRTYPHEHVAWGQKPGAGWAT